MREKPEEEPPQKKAVGRVKTYEALSADDDRGTRLVGPRARR